MSISDRLKRGTTYMKWDAGCLFPKYFLLILCYSIILRVRIVVKGLC